MTAAMAAADSATIVPLNEAGLRLAAAPVKTFGFLVWIGNGPFPASVSKTVATVGY